MVRPAAPGAATGGAEPVSRDAVTGEPPSRDRRQEVATVCRTVAAWDEVTAPARLTAPMPRLARPFWLRCFTDDDAVELHDPPVRHLRVG